MYATTCVCVCVLAINYNTQSAYRLCFIDTIGIGRKTMNYFNFSLKHSAIFENS